MCFIPLVYKAAAATAYEWLKDNYEIHTSGGIDGSRPQA
jgi:hypothetical protein